METIPELLRGAVQRLGRTPMPIIDLVVLLQQGADEIDRLNSIRASLRDDVIEECARACETSDRFRGEYFAAMIRNLKGAL